VVSQFDTNSSIDYASFKGRKMLFCGGYLQALSQCRRVHLGMRYEQSILNQLDGLYEQGNFSCKVYYVHGKNPGNDKFTANL
jgi:hypothetical protein